MRVLDPVCRMWIEDVHAAATLTHRETRYFFCTMVCRDDFARDPARYILGEAAPPPPRDARPELGPREPYARGPPFGAGTAA